MAMKRPLEGIKVVEVAMWAFVPAAGGILSDMGATVIKVGKGLFEEVAIFLRRTPKGLIVIVDAVPCVEGAQRPCGRRRANREGRVRGFCLWRSTSQAPSGDTHPLVLS